ncbi:MAG: oligosaccharide flippase family protein [Candidatus Limnocylindrales bacterium]
MSLALDRSAAAVSRRIATVFTVRVSAAVIGVVNAFVLAHLLGPAGKGDFYLVQLVPSTLLVIGQLGLPSAIAYQAGRGRMKGLAWRSVLLALSLAVAGVGLTLFALPVLETSLFQHVDKSLILVALATVPYTFAFTFGNSILTGRQRVIAYGAIALGQVVLALVLFLVLIGVMGLETRGAILAYLLYTAVGAIAVTYAAFAGPRDGVDPAPVPIRELLSYGLRMYPASMSSFFSYRADVYLLALLGTSSSELGLYSIAVGLAELVFFLPDSVVIVFFPHVAGGTRQEADEQSAVVTRVTIVATGMAAVPLAIAAVFAVHILLPAYVGGLPALFLLLPGVVMLSASKTLSAYLNGIGRGGIVSVTALIALATNIACNLVLIPHFGIRGAATSSLISYSLGAVLQMMIASHLTGKTPRDYLVPTRADLRMVRGRIMDMVARLRAGRLDPGTRP